MILGLVVGAVPILSLTSFFGVDQFGLVAQVEGNIDRICATYLATFFEQVPDLHTEIYSGQGSGQGIARFNRCYLRQNLQDAVFEHFTVEN
jgi:hypothetical protein